MDGGSNDDVLYAVRNRRNRRQILQDEIFELTDGLVPKSSVDSPDIMIGREGEDLFNIRSNKIQGLNSQLPDYKHLKIC